MPQAEISRLEKERGAAVPYNQIFPNADARANLRANLSTQLGSKADFNISSGYLARANRQPQNEDNSVGLMVDALGGLARTRSQGLSAASRSTATAAIRWATSLARSATRTSTASRKSVNARYYPFAWLNTRANLGFDYTLLNVKSLTRFDQGPFGETSRQGAIIGLAHRELAVHARRRRDGHLHPAQQHLRRRRRSVCSTTARTTTSPARRARTTRLAPRRSSAGAIAVGDVGNRPHDHDGHLRRAGVLVQRPSVPHGPRSLRRQQLVR